MRLTAAPAEPISPLAKAVGFGDVVIMEIIAVVFVNVFTNAVNHLAGTEPDAWHQPDDENVLKS